MRPDPFSETHIHHCGPIGLAEGERVLLWMLRQWVTARVLGEEPGARLSQKAGALVSPRVARFAAPFASPRPVRRITPTTNSA